MSCLCFKPDPGPCPICGYPHTACTPATVALQLQISGSQSQSFTVPVPAPMQFTTATYRGVPWLKKPRC